MFIAIGVYLAPGGSVTNAATGYIRGVKISDGAGTVVNDGNITETTHSPPASICILADRSPTERPLISWVSTA
jgi:hypothetical protein